MENSCTEQLYYNTCLRHSGVRFEDAAAWLTCGMNNTWIRNFCVEMYWQYRYETHLHLSTPVWDSVVRKQAHLGVNVTGKHLCGWGRCIKHSWADFC